MKVLASLALLALTIPAAAQAQEAISTSRASDAGPPTQDATPDGQPVQEDPGDWARRVLAGKPAPQEAQPAHQGACPIATNGRPHGEVWGGIGTRGYREIGGVVTQQIGKCSSVTIAVSKTEGPSMGRHPGRRR